MKKIYSFLLFAMLSFNAFAGSDPFYHWFYQRVEAAPTGKGVVYAAGDKDAKPSESDYKEFAETKFYNQGSSFDMMYVWAKPAEGYQFAGWFSSATDEMTLDNLMTSNANDSIEVFTEKVSDNDDVEYYAFVPEDTIYGIFTKVTVKAPEGLPLSNIATLGISKVTNDTGDEITISATPVRESITFDGWTNTQGDTVSKESTYTLTVSDMETYTAHFSGDSIITIDFGEGKYISFSNACSANLSDGITVYRVTPMIYSYEFKDKDGHVIRYEESESAWGYYENEYDGFDIVGQTFIPYPDEVTLESSYTITNNNYYTAGEGVVLYGKGQQFIVLYNDEYPFPSDNYLVGTADGDVNIAELPTADEDGNAITYYTFDGTDFVKATTGIVPQGECYLALDASQYPLPDKIPFAEKVEEAGIDAPTVDAPAALAAPAVKGIYTIDGKRITRPIKGAINIIDGKKVFVK